MQNTSLIEAADAFLPRPRLINPGDVVDGPHAHVKLLEGVYEIVGTARKGRVISVCYGAGGQTANVWWEDEDEPMVVDLETLTLTPRPMKQ